MLKKEIAGLIVEKHKEEKGFDISPVTFQKTLFYIFGFSVFLKDVKLPIFKSSFKPGIYGPRDMDFSDKEIPSLKSEGLKVDNLVLELIDDVCIQTFNISDFALVDMTKDLNCYKESLQGNKEIIPGEWILRDILQKYSPWTYSSDG